MIRLAFGRNGGGTRRFLRLIIFSISIDWKINYRRRADDVRCQRGPPIEAHPIGDDSLKNGQELGGDTEEDQGLEDQDEIGRASCRERV